MRVLPSDLAAHLQGDVTTLCLCWRVTRRDGQVLGFTEHDRDLSFAGTWFRAASGFAASEAGSAAGLAADTSEVAGGFSSDAISEADLAGGRFDGARVEVFRVNWQAPDQHLLIAVQEIGEVTRQSGQFSAELRSLSHRLAREQGRIYNRRCDAALGDALCGVAMTVAGRRADAAVVSVQDSGRIVVSGLGGFGPGHFRSGSLTFSSGPCAGLATDVETSLSTPGGTELVLWLPLPILPEVGDALVVSVGCDKAFATCRDRFSNQVNFRGFPHMPGSDFAYSYADGETLHDGSPLYP
ncbi:DUF2163 domain-containing protein [Rhizobium sp. RU36D]|uniref:DUF2163 domain-containing protein n=1 Tax=Rhizobium sp. RU36D TaxID=1907415 RepID=UPI0009D82F5B|nr:DUF2163 domain-containing protein [Rhizobium sp. RU36D]SMD10882.1 phage conserved hypothetical protein BR0599 [Rhizobium sp. RU36D]